MAGHQLQDCISNEEAVGIFVLFAGFVFYFDLK